MVSTPPNLNPASSDWKLLSTSATAPYCQIMPETGCVKMGFGKQGVCEITALRTMLVETTPPRGVNLVTINGHMSQKARLGVLALNQNDKVACRACTDCDMNEIAVQMCVMDRTMTSNTLRKFASDKTFICACVTCWQGHGCVPVYDICVHDI